MSLICPSMKPVLGVKAQSTEKAAGQSSAKTSNHSESMVIAAKGTRKERNRESARQSRMRRKQLLDDVTAANEGLVSELSEARATIDNLTAQLSRVGDATVSLKEPQQLKKNKDNFATMRAQIHCLQQQVRLLKAKQPSGVCDSGASVHELVSLRELNKTLFAQNQCLQQRLALYDCEAMFSMTVTAPVSTMAFGDVPSLSDFAEKCLDFN